MANGARPPGDITKAAFGALLALKDNLPANCTLEVEDEDEVVISALRRHGEHLSTHAINQGHLDPFKLICWIGCAIIERLDKDVSFHQHEQVLASIIKSLDEVLALETHRAVRLSESDRTLVGRFVMEEIKGNGNHGVGFNGLFLAFHCCRATYRQLRPSRN